MHNAYIHTYIPIDRFVSSLGSTPPRSSLSIRLLLLRTVPRRQTCSLEREETESMHSRTHLCLRNPRGFGSGRFICFSVILSPSSLFHSVNFHRSFASSSFLAFCFPASLRFVENLVVRLTSKPLLQETNRRLACLSKLENSRLVAAKRPNCSPRFFDPIVSRRLLLFTSP